MPDVKGSAIAKATISAKVTRADGTVEDLGVIADVGEEDAVSKMDRLLRSIADKVRKA